MTTGIYSNNKRLINWKSGNVINHISKHIFYIFLCKRQNNMIILINEEQAFDNIQHSLISTFHTNYE